jgi:hypothetical protein
VPIKAIICHDTSQIWVSNKEDAKEIVDLSFVPISPIVQARDTGNGGGLIRICLHSNSGVVAHAQEVVDNLESLVAGREVHGSDVGYLGELGRRVVYRVSVLMFSTSKD